VSDRRRHRLDAGGHRDVRRRSLILRSRLALPMQQDAEVRTEFRSRLDEDAERQERSAADAGDQAMTELHAMTRTAKSALLPVAAAADKTAAPAGVERADAAPPVPLRHRRGRRA
jgi:hypothetical protein